MPPPPDRKRRTKEEMTDENRELFEGILDLRKAGVARRQRFDFAFTTDGVGARLQMRTKATTNDGGLTSMPKRGIRYTQKQRLRELRSRQYADEATRGKPQSVKDAETELAGLLWQASRVA